MDHYIFSNTASYPDKHELVEIVKRDISIVKGLKNGQGSDIYLCGGGIFAGWVLEHNLINILKIKLSPVILGDGIRLFGNSKIHVKMELHDQVVHDHGLIFLTYRLNYSSSMENIVITGVSSGIGLSLWEVYLDHGF